MTLGQLSLHSQDMPTWGDTHAYVCVYEYRYMCVCVFVCECVFMCVCVYLFEEVLLSVMWWAPTNKFTFNFPCICCMDVCVCDVLSLWLLFLQHLAWAHGSMHCQTVSGKRLQRDCLRIEPRCADFGEPLEMLDKIFTRIAPTMPGV